MGENRRIDLKNLHGKRALITGGLGMIGSNLAIRLVDLGAKVSILDANLEPYGANQFNIAEIAHEVETICGDIRDLALVIHYIRGKDLIYNLAGQVSHNDSLVDPFLDVSINYIGHLNVAEAVRKYNPEAKIIYSGSRLQFGRINRNPVDESHPQRPLTPYALHKFAAEKMYTYYYDIHGIRSICFRIANPYGPRGQMKHSKYTIINWFIRQAMDDQIITVFGDGDQIRDYIYISDLVEALVRAGAAEHIEHEIYNVGSGIGTPFVDMVHRIVEIVGSGRVEHVEWPSNYVNVETGDYVTDISKIRGHLDWEPHVPLEEGIHRTWQFYQENRVHYWQ